MFRAFFIWIFLIILVVPQTYSDFEFTNVECASMDESYASFEYCFLKSVNRTYKYGSLKATLHKGPAWNIKVNLAIYKRLNGLKPFLYNLTVDGCKFMKNPNSSPAFGYIFNLFAPFSNINHSCPYDNDVIVEKAPISHLNNQLTNVLPFPTGEYGFFSIWYSYGIKRATVNAYGRLT